MEQQEFNSIILNNYQNSQTGSIPGNRIDFSNNSLESIQYDRLALYKPNFRDTKLTNIKVRFSAISHANFRNTIIKQSDFEGSNILRTVFNNSKIDNTNFKDCNLTMASFENSVISNTDFSGSNLREVNFTNCKFTNVNLQNTDTTEAIFNNCVLNGTEICDENFNFIYSDGKHLGYYSKDKITIGCITNTLDWWLHNHKELGIKNNHHQRSIDRHESTLRFLKDSFKKKP